MKIVMHSRVPLALAQPLPCSATAGYRRIDRISQQTGDCHWADAAGNRSDRTRGLDSLRKSDVASRRRHSEYG